MPTAELEQQAGPADPLAALARRTQGRLAQTRSPRGRPGPGWIYGYLATQLACQLALLLPALAPARIVFRSASLGLSLLFLVIIPSRGRRRHLAEAWGLAVLTVVTLSAFNPSGGALPAVIAHLGFYLAVLAPLFWVARLNVNERTLVGILICLWAFHSASSIVGVLQVTFPGRFQPALTTFIDQRQVLNIRLSSGEWVPRPMGLTDTPGGAGPSGFYATLFGLGMVLSRPFRFAGLAGVLSMMAGMICVYLSQVRVAVVLLGICFSVLTVLFMLSGRLSRLAGALLLGGSVVLISFQLAFAMGGDMMINRLSSLTAGAPIKLYQANRGMMLEDAVVTLLPKYPLGAGLGHWGMMNAYFGSYEDEIGAELQWSGWILDGGVPLVLLYTGGILTVLFSTLRESLKAMDPARRCWVAIVAAHDVATLALCFSYAPFMSATGVEFWLINTVVLHTTLRPNGAVSRRLMRALP